MFTNNFTKLKKYKTREILHSSSFHPFTTWDYIIFRLNKIMKGVSSIQSVEDFCSADLPICYDLSGIQPSNFSQHVLDVPPCFFGLVVNCQRFGVSNNEGRHFIFPRAMIL